MLVVEIFNSWGDAGEDRFVLAVLDDSEGLDRFKHRAMSCCTNVSRERPSVGFGSSHENLPNWPQELVRTHFHIRDTH